MFEQQNIMMFMKNVASLKLSGMLGETSKKTAGEAK